MNLNVEYLFRAIDKMTPVVKKMASSFVVSMKDMAFAVRYYTSPSGPIFSSFKNFSLGMRGIGNDIRKLGKRAKWLSASAGVGVWKALKESMNFEDSQIMFETLIGSAEKGKKLINEIDILAKKTPMGNKILRESAKIMLTYGMNVNKVLPLLKMLGDISGGNSQRFKVLAYNMAQVKSIGKLTGIDLKSLTLSGFNPLAIMAKKTGKDINIFYDAMSKGQISFAMVEKAMKDVTSEGGRFFEAMKKRAKGTMGALDEFLDTFNQGMRDLGDQLKPSFGVILRMMTSIIDKFRESPKWFKIMVASVLALTAVLSPLLIVLGGLVFTIGLLISPFGLIAIAITGVIGIFLYWKEIILGLDNYLKKLWEDLKVIGEAFKKFLFWKKDLSDDELLEVNKNISGIGGTNKFDIRNLLKIENKNNSELNYTPIPSQGAGQSMAY